MNAEFARGSVILCNDCRRPVFALERGIGPLEKPNRAITAFRPLRQADIDGLLTDRPDVPWWYQRNVRQWIATPQGRRIFEAERPRTGDDCDCPVCGGTWAFFQERLPGSAHDKGYTLCLLDIPPLPATASRLGARSLWKDMGPDPGLVVEERPAS